MPETIRLCRIAALMAATSVLASACSTPPAAKRAETVIEVQRDENGGQFTLLRLADSLASEGRYAAAIPIYRRAHDQNSGDNSPLIGLGQALSALGQYEEAVEVFETAVGNNNQDSRALRGLGTAWIALDRPGLALPLFDQALNLNRRDSEALNGRAVALDALGQHSEAVNTFRRALDIAPSGLQVRNNYGLSLALAGDLDEAIPILEEAALDPNATAQHRQNLALAYGLAGRDRAAARVAGIDLDAASVDANLVFFAELRGMTPDNRRRAVFSGFRNPKFDTSQPANQAYTTEPATANASVARIVREDEVAELEPEPLPEPELEPEPEPEPAPVVEFDIPPLVDPTGYAVQLAAYRHASELMPGWSILSTTYADLIGHLEPRRSEKDFGDRDEDPRGFFYRLNAGPLWTLGEAQDICVEIHSRDGDCWVRPPEPTEGRLPEESERTENLPQESAEIEDLPERSERTEDLPDVNTEPQVIPG